MKKENKIILGIASVFIILAIGSKFGLFAVFLEEAGYIPIGEFTDQFVLWEFTPEQEFNLGSITGGDVAFIISPGVEASGWLYGGGTASLIGFPLYAHHIKFDYYLYADGGQVTSTSSFTVLGEGNSVTADAQNSDEKYGSIEIIPSVLDSTQIEVLVDGVSKGVKTISEDDILTISFSGSGQIAASGHGRFYNFRYKPLFSCQIGTNDLLAMETFAAGTELSIYSTRYEVQSFCLDHPVIITSPEGSTTTAEPYNLWVLGETLTVPADETWTVFYVLHNDGSIPVTCAGEAYDVENDRCTEVTGIVQICSQGTFDPSTGLCVVTPESTIVCPEGGYYDTAQGVCIYHPPIQYICEIGTYSSVSGKCEYTPDVEGICTTGTWNPTSGFCEVFPSSQIICDPYFAYDATLDKCIREPETENVCLSGTYDESIDKCVKNPETEYSCITGTLQYDGSVYSCVYTPDVVGQCLQGTFDETLNACVYEPNIQYLCLVGELKIDSEGKEYCEIYPIQTIVCLPGCGYDYELEQCVCVEEGVTQTRPPVVTVTPKGDVEEPAKEIDIYTIVVWILIGAIIYYVIFEAGPKKGLIKKKRK